MKDCENKIRSLITGCQKQDRESQELLYKEFYGYGMSICLRYVDNRDEAAEILNDSYMKVFTNIQKFDLEKPFKPWLRQIIVNTAINHYRKQKRTLKFNEIGNETQQADVEYTYSNISYNEMLDLLKKVPLSYRTVFNLFVIEGYKHEEIATMLNISSGTSKSALFKAKDLLKKYLHSFSELSYVEK